MPPPIQYQSAEVTVHGTKVVLPVLALAKLTSGNMTGGGTPTQDPPGFVSGSCPHHHQRGHLIGNALGGPGTNPNLVTLTEGTNHPYMYEFESEVRKHVGANPGRTFDYVVCADYVESDYLGDPRRLGVAGNPYCVFPAPSRLRVYLFDALSKVPQLTKQIPDDNRTPDSNGLMVLNGIYKFHSGSPTHVARGCWASMDNTPSVRCVSCPRERLNTSSMFHRWHVCTNCHRQYCNSCGVGLRSTQSLFSDWRVRHCPNCGNIMMLW